MNNPWTPERVKRLTELWLSGWTRAQVAADLGPPITESAVKGKVRRLGLKRDGAAAVKRDASEPGPRRGAAAPATDASGRKRGAARGDNRVIRRPSAPAAEEPAAAAEALPQADAAVEEPAGEASRRGDGLPEQPPAPATEDWSRAGGEAATAAACAADGNAEHTEPRQFRFPGYNECHWPHGEPDNPDFGFCLAPAAPGKSYCDEHAEQAYRKKGS